MEKQSIFAPRPDSVNAIDPNTTKRQQLHSFKAINAIGAGRKDSQWGGAVDKIGSVLTKKAMAILKKIAKNDR